MKTELDKFYALIDEIKIAMMTTRRPDGHLESRAMANQKRADGADLWFVTAEGTTKLRDIEHDQHINLAYYKPGSYEWVSASGIASVSRDRGQIRKLYEPDWKAWFGQEGDPRHGTADDPRIVLIGVDVQCGGLSRGRQAEAGRPVRTGEGLADRWTGGARRDTRVEAAASIAMAEATCSAGSSA
jgi:general stress protein 26